MADICKKNASGVTASADTCHTQQLIVLVVHCPAARLNQMNDKIAESLVFASGNLREPPPLPRQGLEFSYANLVRTALLHWFGRSTCWETVRMSPVTVLALGRTVIISLIIFSCSFPFQYVLRCFLNAMYNLEKNRTFVFVLSIEKYRYKRTGNSGSFLKIPFY